MFSLNQKDECFDFNFLLYAAVMRYDFISLKDKSKELNSNEANFHCPYEFCKKSYFNIKSLKRHFKNIHHVEFFHFNNYNCKICYFRFRNSSEYMSHLNVCHNINLYPYSKKKTIYKNDISCQICDIKLENELELQYHVKKSHTFSHYINPQKDNIYHCPIYSCKKSYHKICTLKDHVSKEHNKNLDLFYLFSCNFCGDRFQDGPQLKIHKLYKHTL